MSKEMEIFSCEVKGKPVEVYYVATNCTKVEDAAKEFHEAIPDGQKIKIPLRAEISFNCLREQKITFKNDLDQEIIDMTMGLIWLLRCVDGGEPLVIDIINEHSNKAVVSFDEFEDEAYLYGSEFEAREAINFLTQMDAITAA